MSTLPKDLMVYPKKSKRRSDREVILLLHGAGGKTHDWTNPMWRPYNYNRKHEPTKRIKIMDMHSPPPNPLHVEFSLSAKMPVHNWKDFLIDLGHTVITYSQLGNDKEVAIPLEELVNAVIPYIKENVLIGKLKDSKVTIIAHSRGGLLISKYLHEVSQEESSSWIKKVITIESPHRGTELPYLNDFSFSWLEAALIGLTGDFTLTILNIIKTLYMEFMVINEGHDELEPTSELIRSLNPDISPNPNIEFHTIGGNSVELTKVYNWVWAPESFVPKSPDLNPLTIEPRFDWFQSPNEFKSVSPLLNAIPDITGYDELRDGKGDILVTDESARLGYANHKTLHINHAEGLWHPKLLEYVAGLIGTPAKPKLAENIRYYANVRTKQFHDLYNTTNNCNIFNIKYGTLLYTNDIEEIKSMGYDGCYFCNSINHENK